MANEKKCTICGKEYTHCHKCELMKAWRFYADTHECYQIWSILSDLRESVINETQAAQMFDNIGVTVEKAKENYIEAVANEITRIITKAEATVEPDTEKVIKKSKKKTDN